jgi:hypothetical protein
MGTHDNFHAAHGSMGEIAVPEWAERCALGHCTSFQKELK